MLRGLGSPGVAASAAALLVLLSPIGFLVATLPGPAAAALLGSTLLFARLLAPTAEGDGGPRRTLSLWFGVCLLHPGLLLMLPAVLCRVLRSSQRAELSPQTRRKIWLEAGLFAAGLAALLAIASIGRNERTGGRGFWEQLGAGLVGSAGVGSPSSLVWGLVFCPMVGIALLGLVELCRRPENESESRAPAWLWLFGGIPLLVQLLGLRPSLEMACWALGPALALGLTGWTTRQLEGGRSRLIAVVIAAQVLLTVSFHWSMTAGDPNRGWTEMASEMLNPGDLVITRDQQHDYLLYHRFGVQTLNLRDPVGLEVIERADWWDAARQRVSVQQRTGGRVWVDWKLDPALGGTRGYAFQAELHELILLAPVHHLDSGVSEEKTPLIAPEPSSLEDF
jgi:hypothetical protein